MDPNEHRLMTLVNLLTDTFYPNPEDPGPIGPWGPWIRDALIDGPTPAWRRGMGPRPEPWVVRFGASERDLASLNPQPIPPGDFGMGYAMALSTVAVNRAIEAGRDAGGGLLRRFADDWCGTPSRVPVPRPPGGSGDPRPPRPVESLVLGAALVRAASRSEAAPLKAAVEEAGRRIFAQGLSGMEMPSG